MSEYEQVYDNTNWRHYYVDYSDTQPEEEGVFDVMEMTLEDLERWMAQEEERLKQEE